MKHEITKIAVTSLFSGGIVAISSIVWFLSSDNLASFIARSDPVQIEIDRRIDARFDKIEGDFKSTLTVLESRVHGLSSRVGVLASKIENQNEQLSNTNRMLEQIIFNRAPVDHGGRR